MSDAVTASRLGLWTDLVPRFAAAGWIVDDVVAPSAVPLLTAMRAGPEPEAAFERLAAVLDESPQVGAAALAEPDLGAALAAICGASRALSRAVQENPEWLAADDAPAPEAEPAALRRFVRRGLLRVAVRDLLGVANMPQVGRELSDLADAAAHAALEHAIDLARRRPDHTDLPPVPFCVIAMGKWGGAELNYASDIDVLFVHDTPPGVPGDRATAFARRVAEGFMDALGGVTAEGIAFRVDADLRPEGRAGALTRSLDSYRSYYDRWAEPWEFQALIKARPAAGDPDLGAAFRTLITPYVYPDTLGADTIRSIRTMKARAEDQARSRGNGDREVKLGPGGIRDAEFAVQLLQLVHGRSDPALRSSGTLAALTALRDGGYVRAEDADSLAVSYPWLRDLEHRIQIYDMRQTHELPADDRGRERIARAMGYRDAGLTTARELFEADLVTHRAAVRTIHQRLFYRPLLEAFAESPAVRLDIAGVARQLAALGFSDTEGARRAFDELTAGLSRRSSLMQQLLPLMLDWLSQAPDPDLGLAQLRLLVTTTPDNARLVAALRDSPVAAERLCRLLGTSRLLGQLVDRIPESLDYLGDDASLARVPDRDARITAVTSQMAARADGEQRPAALRRFVRRGLLRVAVRDLLGVANMPQVGRELSDLADAAAHAALEHAIDLARRRPDHTDLPPVPFCVIAMGKWGGAELNYASDIDVLFVHDTPPGVPGDRATAFARRVAEGFMDALGGVTAEGIAFRVDADLRPEGRAGALTRSLDSYRSYYDRWAEPWEFQALIKARPAAGDPDLGAAFRTLITPYVYPDTLGADTIRSIRTMKARIEQERIAPDEDPAFHMKLGTGSMSDVEFAVQLLQLMHGGTRPALRTTSTLSGIEALADAELLTTEEAHHLADAYRFCGRVRNRLFLQAGRGRDSLPGDPDQATRLGLSLGYQVHPRTTLRETYRRVTRRSRRVVDRRFYGLGG